MGWGTAPTLPWQLAGGSRALNFELNSMLRLLGWELG